MKKLIALLAIPSIWRYSAIPFKSWWWFAHQNNKGKWKKTDKKCADNIEQVFGDLNLLLGYFLPSWIGTGSRNFHLIVNRFLGCLGCILSRFLVNIGYRFLSSDFWHTVTHAWCISLRKCVGISRADGRFLRSGKWAGTYRADRRDRAKMYQVISLGFENVFLM